MERSMSEHTQNRTIRQALKGMDPFRVENRVGPGTPDWNYIDGWLEAKWLRRWPKNANESPVLIDHWTIVQRRWHERRCRAAGGRTFVLLQVGREWLLFRGPEAAEYLGRGTRQVLEAAACHHWRKGLRAEELRHWLRG
jgi:hypothetical protein